MRKKIFASVIVIAMAVTLLGGCAPKTSNKEGDVPTVTWYITNDTLTDRQTVLDVFNEKLVEKIGAKLDMQFIDNGSYNDKMNMIIASGKEFDLCFTSDWTNKFLPNVKKGGYMDITELLEKETPGLKAALPDYLWSAGTVNDKIYAVPNNQVIFYQIALCFSQEIAEKYEFDVDSLKTTTDIEPLLAKVKENEPNMFPYRYGYGITTFISPYYEQIEPSTGIAIRKDGTGEPVVLADTPEFRDGINILTDWYDKGYIRSDINSMINDDAEIKAGKYAVTQGVYKPGGTVTGDGKEAYAIPIEQPYLKANAGMPAMTSVSRTSKNPEKALKLLEVINTDKEMLNLLSFGIEGRHYTKVNENTIELIPDTGYNISAWKIGNQFNALFLKGQEDTIWDETIALNDQSVKSPISGFVFDTDPVKTELSQLATVVKEYSAVYNGSEKLGELYQTYLKKLDEAGIQTVREEVKKQIEDWKAGK